MNDAAKTPTPTRVAWLAGAATVYHRAPVLQPLSTGLFRSEVALLLCAPAAAPADLLEPAVDVRRYRQPWRGFGRKRARQQVANHVRDFGVDVIHALDASSAALAADVAERADRPYVVSCYGVTDRRYLERRDERLVGVLAAGQAVRERLERGRGMHAPVRVVQPGLDAAGPAKHLPRSDRIVTILADAMGDNRQAMQVLLEAYAELLQRDHACALFIMDSGRQERRLRTHARQLGVSAEVTFVNPQPDTDYGDIIHGADVFVAAPAHRELSLHTLQAMGAGVPVMAWPDAAADYVIDGETARVPDGVSAAAATRTLTEMLTDHGGTDAQAERALGYVRQKHDPARMVADVAAFYREVLSDEAVAETPEPDGQSEPAKEDEPTDQAAADRE
ncbi:MAG: glycosyltransferase [Planctomycetes bacterium]|nr:glycosyltransferase [Planctomycetota bacterium]